MNRKAKTRKKSHRGPPKKRKRSRSPKSSPPPSPKPADTVDNPEPETKVVPESEAGPHAQPGTEPEAEPQTESEAKPEADPKTESEPELEEEPETESEEKEEPESEVGIKLEEEWDSKRSVKNMGTSETKKAVYLFFDNRYVPYNHTLYAVDFPNNVNDASLDSGPVKLSPVLAFESEKYPNHMSCVEVEGKLYFVGGNLRSLPRDVYIFDPLTASQDKPLTKGPKMNTGKCNPFAFVVGKDIYVLSQRRVPSLSGFEVLRADASGHYAEWEILKDPPFYGGHIFGHVVIGDKVFISDKCQHRYYDTISGEWSDAYGASYILRNKAHFVDNHVYTCISPYAVISHNFPDTIEAFYHCGSLWSLKVLHETVQLGQPLHSLAYIGGGRFCHVLCGPRGDFNFPRHEFLERNFLGLTIFKACTEAYFDDENETYSDEENETYSDDEKERYFRSYCLQSMHFAIENPDPCIFILKHSFVLPSCRVEQNLEKMALDDRNKMVFSRIPICEELKLQLGLKSNKV